MKKIITLILILTYCTIQAQGVGINTDAPDSNAILDINSDTKGVLLTRLELVAIDNPAPLSNHVEGVITYNTTVSPTQTSVSVYEGLYYNDGVNWNFMGPNTLALGDIKYSLETTDHKGWFLLDGRTIASLPAVAQYNATAVGIGTNLPLSSDRLIKTNNGSETQGSVSGSNTVTLSQANLPNVSFSATTSSNGSHTHDYSDSYNGIKTLGLATNVLPLVPLYTETVGINDSVPANLFTTVSSGAHTHSITAPSGGSGTPINATPKHIVTNVFIFLGE
nr:hypothetical protein [uncultured Flavobacterium sp.]